MLRLHPLLIAVSLALVSVAMAQNATPQRAAAAAGDRFSVVDTTHDGSLSLPELQAVKSPIASQFTRLDKNGDGKLQRNEVSMFPIFNPQRAQAQQPAAQNAQKMLWLGDLDANHDGRITAAEASAVPVVAKSFAAMDLNHDGMLTNAEVQADWQQGIARRNAAERPSRLAAFDKADNNKDGKLSPAEAKAGMPRMAAIFAVLDTNKDGSLSREEVAVAGQFFMRATIGQWRQRNAQAFAAMDANKDGKLSQAEVQAKMPRLANSFAFLDENHDGFLSQAEFTLPLN